MRGSGPHACDRTWRRRRTRTRGCSRSSATGTARSSSRAFCRLAWPSSAQRPRSPADHLRPRRRAASRDRETALLYGSLALLTFWTSFGPRAGLYSVLYQVCPSSRSFARRNAMGIVVMLCLAVFAAYAVRALRRRCPGRAGIVAAGLCAAAMIELNDIPFDWRTDEAIPGGLSAPRADAARRRWRSFRSTTAASTSTCTPGTC